MNELERSQIKMLNRMSSEDAATWLMTEYPIDSPGYGVAIKLLAHKSWKKSDQLRLARYYFQKIPFASIKTYEVFASFMSIPSFLGVVKEYIPTEKNKLDLLLYYLRPVLEGRVRRVSDAKLVERFLDDLNDRK